MLDDVVQRLGENDLDRAHFLGAEVQGLQRVHALADADEPGLRTYTLAYPDLGRTLAITFSADFPHTVERWTETRGSGSDALTTTATRRDREMMAYWGLNSRTDVERRAALGLDS